MPGFVQGGSVGEGTRGTASPSRLLGPAGPPPQAPEQQEVVSAGKLGLFTAATGLSWALGSYGFLCRAVLPGL